MSLTLPPGRYLSVNGEFGARLSVRVVEKFQNVRSKFAWVGDVFRSYRARERLDENRAYFHRFTIDSSDGSRRFFGSGPRCPKHSSPTPSDRWRCRRRRSLFSALSLDIPPPPSSLVHLSIACTFTRIVIVGCRQRFGHTGRVRERYSRFCFLGCSCFCPVGFFLFCRCTGHAPLPSSRYSSLPLVRRSVSTAGIVRYHTLKPDPSSVREFAGFHHHRRVPISATENRVSIVASTTSVRRVSSSAPRFRGYAVCALWPPSIAVNSVLWRFFFLKQKFYFLFSNRISPVDRPLRTVVRRSGCRRPECCVCWRP